MITNLEKRLDRLEVAQLIQIYNSVAKRPVTRMSDKTTAVKRTRMALEEAGMDYVIEKGEVVVRPLEAQGRPGDSRRITAVAENPKRPGSASHARFGMYRVGMTVGEYVDLAVKNTGVPRAKAIRDIRWDSAHGYVTLEKA